MDAPLLSDRSDEQPLSHRDKEPTATVKAIAAAIVIAVVACVALVLVTLAWAMFMVLTTRPPVFSVTVDGFSGIEDHVPRAFNLTMRISNLAGESEVCVGGEAVVLYGGVPLAVGDMEELCVPRNGTADMAFVAASGGVGLPKALAELMAAEKRVDGAVRMEVRVITRKHRWFFSCPATLDQGAARPYPCKKLFWVDESNGVRPDGSGTPGSPF